MNNKKVAIIISPNYKDYAKKYLKDCIASVNLQDYQGEIKVFITDNESSDESYAYLKSKLPKAYIHQNKKNNGFAKGCNDSMKVALESGYDYIFLVSIHSALEPACVRELVKVAESDEKIAVAQARMMFWDNNMINSLGNETHFLGFGYSSGYKEEWEGQIKSIKEIFYPSGASMFFKRQALLEVGLFDEEYWMYNEDQELPWRMKLAGWKAVLAPQAIARTKYEFQRSIKKFYWMDRNRILAILECYHILTLILISPAFIVMELGLILFSLKSGWFKDKIRVWAYFLSIKNWQYILRARKRNQSLRKIKDKNIVKLISGKIWYQEVDDWKLRFINPIFGLYWKVAKKIIIW